MYEEIKLPNGVRIVWEKMPAVRSAAVGIWIGAGSRNEKRSENGAAHFIEHMLFKGTDRYSAAELADLMDGMGGQVNAYTTREHTCFYARVPDYHFDSVSELLAGMLFDSRLDQNDVESERGVVFEEIGMYEDTPEDLVAERMLALSFKGALGRPVLGTESTLSGMTGESLRAFMESNYTGDRIVVALAGNFSDSSVNRLIGEFSRAKKGRPRRMRAAAYEQSVTVRKKATEQNQFCLGFPGISTSDDDRFTMQLMSNILGGGVSSRLFQTVREKYGLCYSVYSFGASFSDTGLFGVGTAVGRDTEEKALKLIMGELRRFADDGVTATELDRAREQMKANILMSLESTTSRMTRLGGGVLQLGKCMEPEEVVARYDAVTCGDVRSAAQKILDFDRMSFSAVGRVRSAEEYLRILA